MTHLLKIQCSVSHVLQVPEENIPRVLSESAMGRAPFRICHGEVSHCTCRILCTEEPSAGGMDFGRKTPEAWILSSLGFNGTGLNVTQSSKT